MSGRSLPLAQIFWPKDLLSCSVRCYLVGFNSTGFNCVISMLLPCDKFPLDALTKVVSTIKMRDQECGDSFLGSPVVLGEWIPGGVGMFDYLSPGDSQSEPDAVPFLSRNIWLVLTSCAGKGSLEVMKLFSAGNVYSVAYRLVCYSRIATDRVIMYHSNYYRRSQLSSRQLEFTLQKYRSTYKPYSGPVNVSSYPVTVKFNQYVNIEDDETISLLSHPTSDELSATACPGFNHGYPPLTFLQLSLVQTWIGFELENHVRRLFRSSTTTVTHEKRQSSVKQSSEYDDSWLNRLLQRCYTGIEAFAIFLVLHSFTAQYVNEKILALGYYFDFLGEVQSLMESLMGVSSVQGLKRLGIVVADNNEYELRDKREKCFFPALVFEQNRAHASFSEFVAVTVLDVMIGCVFGYLIYQNNASLLLLCRYIGNLIQNKVIIETVEWFNADPLGIKTNIVCTRLISEVIVMIFQCIGLIATNILDNQYTELMILNAIAGVGVCGVVLQLMIIIDLIRLFTYHCRLIYMLLVAILSGIWSILLSLSYVFNGFKIRSDDFILKGYFETSEDGRYTSPQLLCGTLLFSLVLFLFPSFLLFFIYFSVIYICIQLIITLLWVFSALVNDFPLYLSILQAMHPGRVLDLNAINLKNTLNSKDDEYDVFGSHDMFNLNNAKQLDIVMWYEPVSLITLLSLMYRRSLESVMSLIIALLATPVAVIKSSKRSFLLSVNAFIVNVNARGIVGLIVWWDHVLLTAQSVKNDGSCR